MNIELILFGAFALLTLLSAGMVIFARSPINSAMALVSTFFFLAGIYVLLWAHTVAVLQVLVYAGAIMVLFLFVIMLLNLGESPTRGRPTLARIAGGAATVGLLAVLAIILTKVPEQPAAMGPAAQASFGTMATLGEVIFTQWLLPFEAVSLLLLVAMVGAVVVAKSRI
ncbi:NADH-quinone oxidoreductase subunit J [Pyxidicoccus sp. 3LG]